MGNTNSTTALTKHSKCYLKYQNEFCRNIVVAYSVNITKYIVDPDLPWIRFVQYIDKTNYAR